MAADLVDVFVVFGAALGGGLVTGAFDAGMSWLRRPVLKLEFDRSDDAYMTSAEWLENGARVEYDYVRVRLVNEGVAAAKNCRVFLTDIKEIKNGAEQRTSYADSMPLGWAGGNEFEARDIPRDVKTFINLVRIPKHRNGWIFEVKQVFSSLQAMETLSGTYRFSLIATADEAEAQSLVVDVTYRQTPGSLHAVKVR